jgi:phage tail-like protein
MPEFTVNPTRFDPYKNFKFRIKWDGRYVAGISHVSALLRRTEVVEHREGGDPSISRKSPGLTAFEPITLERGVSHDTAFEDWANLVWKFGAGLGAEAALKEFRKDIIIEFSTRPGSWRWLIKCSAAGYRSTRRSRTWIRTPTRWRFSTSNSKTRAGNVTRA